MSLFVPYSFMPKCPEDERWSPEVNNLDSSQYYAVPLPLGLAASFILPSTLLFDGSQILLQIAEKIYFEKFVEVSLVECDKGSQRLVGSMNQAVSNRVMKHVYPGALVQGTVRQVLNGLCMAAILYRIPCDYLSVPWNAMQPSENVSSHFVTLHTCPIRCISFLPDSKIWRFYRHR